MVGHAPDCQCHHLLVSNPRQGQRRSNVGEVNGDSGAYVLTLASGPEHTDV